MNTRQSSSVIDGPGVIDDDIVTQVVLYVVRRRRRRRPDDDDDVPAVDVVDRVIRCRCPTEGRRRRPSRQTSDGPLSVSSVVVGQQTSSVVDVVRPYTEN